MDCARGNDSFLQRIQAAVFCLLCACSGSAYGQALPEDYSEQTLDRIDVIEARGALNVAVDIDAPEAIKPWVATDYPAVSGKAFTACQNTSTRGLYCLDRNAVRHWPDPDKLPPLEPVDGGELFSCTHAVFGFDRDNACSALTVDLGGNLWIAGKRKSKFSLYKVVQGACPASTASSSTSAWTAFTTDAGSFCAREYASGRPLLTGLTVVDGDVATAFPYSLGDGGIIAVEQGKDVTFFPDAPQAVPVSLGTAKAWGLVKHEQLQAATLLQKPLPVDSRNWVLVVTSNGRLLSREIPWAGAAKPVINHSVPGGPIDLVAPTSCGADTLYDIRTSVKTRAAFVSDRRGGRVLALRSNIDTVPAGAPLVFTSQQVIASLTPPSSQVATLTAPPEGLSIAPGIEVDLRADCGFDDSGQPRVCGIVPDGTDPNFAPAATLTGVRIDDGTQGGLTVFQVRNIPDCRYLAYSAQPAECRNGAMLTGSGRVIDDPNDPEEYTPAGFPVNPHALFLDVAKLMPPEITKATTLPRMLISPRYRALSDTSTFDALFGITDEGVRFRETFRGNLHLDDLIPGRKLGCGGERTIDTATGPNFDIVLTISERYTTVGGLPDGGRQHTDMLVNTYGCDPDDPPVAGTRWSLYAYGMQLAPELVRNRQDASQLEVRYPDSIYARLVLSLFRDLGATIDDYLCVDRDGGNGAPIPASQCPALMSRWSNTYDKLAKCVESSTQPMNSTEIRTCNAFEVQYAKLVPLVQGLTRPEGILDPANRIGEAKARLEVFRYIYDAQFKPSIPPRTGFVDGL